VPLSFPQQIGIAGRLMRARKAAKRALDACQQRWNAGVPGMKRDPDNPLRP
jgi:hypothetical protein